MRKVLLLSASFLLLLNACKKEGELNPDYLQNKPGSFFTDSIAIVSATRRGDTILADKVATGLFGTYRDSAFGKTTSSIYLQPLLPTNSLVLKNENEQLFVDSVVLSLPYNDWFGDTTVPQNVDVFELDEKLNFESFYFSDTSIRILPTALGSKTFYPRPRKSIIINEPNESGGIDTSSFSAQLRIKLDNSLGDRIISKSGEMELANNENFTSFFKGMKITPNEMGTLNDNEKAILYFALTSSQTKLSVYYYAVTNQNDTIKKQVNFPINSSSVRFSTFTNDYSNSAVQSKLQNSSMDSLHNYVQAMAGVETVLRFPNLRERFENGRVIINKAELILPVSGGSYNKFGVANTLILANRDMNGVLQFIPDFFEDETYFGGFYNPENGEYRFNIARYIQGLIDGSEQSQALTVLVTGSAVKAERAVLNSEKHPSRKIKLNLYYSKPD